MKKLIFILICLLLAVMCVAMQTTTDDDTIKAKVKPKQDIIMTVRGPIRPSELGKTLAHEHIICDFIGAAETGRHRYDPKKVVETMLPFLQDVKSRGFTGFVDCTPAWLGQDVEVLLRLAELTDLHILTNTGYYATGEGKFLPPHAFTETADQLAARWVKEWQHGIDETGVKPGFIKVSVNKGPLSDIDKKIVLAAAKAHLQTGLTIACHTAEAQAALGVLENITAQGVAPSALIVVHADAIADANIHIQLAGAGAWVEYDAVSDNSIKKHVRLISRIFEAGFGDRLLISHDAGWYEVGHADGAKAKIRPYTAISDRLIPALKAANVTDAKLHKLLVDNPANAYTVRLRR